MKTILRLMIAASVAVFIACSGGTTSQTDEKLEGIESKTNSDSTEKVDETKNTETEDSNAMVSEVYNMKVVSLLDGSEVSLADHKDKVIFLNFWATWCRPCVMEMPSIASLYKQMKGKNVEFLVISNESAEVLKAFEKKNNFGVPLYVMKDVIPTVYNGEYIPRTYIVKDGKIVSEHTGGAKWDDPKIIKMIDSLLVK